MLLRDFAAESCFLGECFANDDGVKDGCFAVVARRSVLKEVLVWRHLVVRDVERKDRAVERTEVVT